jgi:hypothetical protein
MAPSNPPRRRAGWLVAGIVAIVALLTMLPMFMKSWPVEEAQPGVDRNVTGTTGVPPVDEPVAGASSGPTADRDTCVFPVGPDVKRDAAVAYLDRQALHVVDATPFAFPDEHMVLEGRTNEEQPDRPHCGVYVPAATAPGQAQQGVTARDYYLKTAPNRYLKVTLQPAVPRVP